jgi:chromosome segregation ATPase
MDAAEAEATRQRLTVVRPGPKDARANMAAIVGQFVELQKQVGEGVVALEESVRQQRDEISTASNQLPEMKEKINWLIASFYEQAKKDENFLRRLNHHEEGLTTVVEAVRSLCEAQILWRSTIDGLIDVMTRIKSLPIPTLPTFEPLKPE